MLPSSVVPGRFRTNPAGCVFFALGNGLAGVNVASVRSIVAGGINIQYIPQDVPGLTRAYVMDDGAEGVHVNARVARRAPSRSPRAALCNRHGEGLELFTCPILTPFHACWLQIVLRFGFGGTQMHVDPGPRQKTTPTAPRGRSLMRRRTAAANVTVKLRKKSEHSWLLAVVVLVSTVLAPSTSLSLQISCEP
jgi:hypothetical protein